MLWALILLPMIFAFFILVGTNMLNEDHSILKLFSFLLGIVSFWASLNMAFIMVVSEYTIPAAEKLLGQLTYLTGWLFFIYVSYFAIYIIKTVFHGINSKKEQRLKY